VGGIVIGIIALLAIAFDQYKIVFLIKDIRQTDESTVLPYIERS